MLEVLLQMAALILCGVLWRMLNPGDLDSGAVRTALTGLVYYIFLPALVLLVLWQAQLGVSSIKIAVVAACAVLSSLLLTQWLCGICGMDLPTKGAVMLAAAFPNATYLGLPVLEATLGQEARSIAIQFDLFACTPLLLTVGIWIAAKHGHITQRVSWSGIFKVPAVWAAILAICLNILTIPLAPAIFSWLQTLANGVVPLMLISLGLSLSVDRKLLPAMRSLLPVVGVQLAAMPAVAMGIALLLGLRGLNYQAVVLEAAMPSMVLGLVFCDRFGLNTAIYAAAVTVTTILSFFSLSLWYGLVQ